MKKYLPTTHAIQRATERLGIVPEQAANHLNQLMQTAYFVGTTPRPSGKQAQVFDHYKSETRLIVGDNDSIITVYKFPQIEQTLPQTFADDIRQLVKRKFGAMQREFKRKQRALEIELAAHGLEVAQLKLNQAKAKSPKVRSAIADKLREIKTKIERVQYELDTATSDFAKVRTEVEAYL